MDKYARKQIARWEQKKAKTEHQFEERTKESAYRRAWTTIALAIQTYTPTPAAVFTKALALLSDPMLRSVRMHGLHWPLFVNVGPWIYIDYHRYYADLGPVDILAETIRARESKLTHVACELIPILVRHMDRVDAIREELLARAQRNRVIQDCRLVWKEELMMAAWHPRRVGRILETYGWEALDNLLGVE